MHTLPVTCVASVRAAHTQFHVVPTARSTPENTAHLAVSASCDRNTRLTNLSDSSRPTPSISRRRRRAPALEGDGSAHVSVGPSEGASVAGAVSSNKLRLFPVRCSNSKVRLIFISLTRGTTWLIDEL